MVDIRLTLLLIINITAGIIQAEKNVAVGKLTKQSSTYSMFASSRAVDGNTNSDFSQNSCTHTDVGFLNWWCVDLVESINIETMEIYNRNSNKGQLQGFEIRLSSTGSCDVAGFQSAELCYKDTTTTPQDIYSVEQCTQTSSTRFNGRFVFISHEQPAKKTAVVLCEVKIFEECSINCQSSKCDSMGVCIGCIDGRYGNQCDGMCSSNCNNGCQQTGVCGSCNNGWYGDFCNNSCSDGCLSDGSLSSCNGNGKCFHGCINGRSGRQCDINCTQYCTKCQRNDASSCLRCINGRFGESCDELCNINCKSVKQASGPVCDITNGFCTLGCRDGFYGDGCKTLCSPGCQDRLCGQTNGFCINGCVAGKTGDNCITDCRDGWYGVNCTSKCGQCADDIKCDGSTGSCGLAGCQDGYTGPKCQTDDAAVSHVVSGIIGSLITAVIFMSCIAIYCYCKRK